MKYESGEEILKGDRILFHGEEAEIEFVVEETTGDLAQDWYIKEFGPGVMISEPKVFGRAYQRETEGAEYLVFVSRSSPPRTR